MEVLVDMTDICKIYNPGENEVRALDHVNVRINRGEFVAIIGQSGSGKSTLMNMIGCLDVPTSGRYVLSGQDVSGMSDDQLSDVRNREIGFIFQGFNLIANLTARENVELPLIYRGVPKKERQDLSASALEKVGLGNRMTHKPSEMSGGQQQRVAIARAIAQAPPVILADEPTGNLDSASSKEILGILKQLHSDGRTIILITHDNGIAQQARRVIRIMDGKIVEDYQNEQQAENNASYAEENTKTRENVRNVNEETAEDTSAAAVYETASTASEVSSEDVSAAAAYESMPAYGTTASADEPGATADEAAADQNINNDSDQNIPVQE
ncbi:MAG: ATP-binding cassette domain-containing protein [Lachnospiraceae bacterium]|nr:ATP-binding cassette domain-containing protein [Lachnospiraceae bacterium]